MVSEIRVPSSSSSDVWSAHVRGRVMRHCQHVPTVMGWILTPSSTCATVGSSDSLCSRTFLPQRVLTNVVRPVPEAPHTIRQNWIPFLTFFFLRVLSICTAISGVSMARCGHGEKGSGRVCLRNRWSRGKSYRRHVGVGTLTVVCMCVWGRKPADEAADVFKGGGRVVRRSEVFVMSAGVVEEIWGTLAAAPCAMQRGSLAPAAPVVVSCLGATTWRDSVLGGLHRRTAQDELQNSMAPREELGERLCVLQIAHV
jgi:hypothetical protein